MGVTQWLDHLKQINDTIQLYAIEQQGLAATLKIQY